MLQQTPDSEPTFKMLAGTYTTAHPGMSRGSTRCSHQKKFADGVTAGLDWVFQPDSILDVVYTNFSTFIVS